jgi:hypothetical protein
MNSDIQPIHSRLMDAKETANHLKLDEKTVSRWARKAYIPAHPLGEGKRKFWRFYEHELSAWLSAQFNGAGQLASSQASESAPAGISETVNSRPGIARPPGLIIEPRAVTNSRPRRYQRGSLSLLKHRNTTDAWVFRYYANANGRRVY